MSALDAAKMESARRQLYSGFHKGEAMGTSIEAEVVVRTIVETVESSEEDVEMKQTTVVEVVSTKKSKKRKGQDGEVITEVVAEIKLSKEERRAAKLLRKAGKATTLASSIASTSTLVTPADSESDIPLPKKSKSAKSKKVVDSAPASPRGALTIEERASLEEEEYQSALRAARKAAKKEAKASRTAPETIAVESKKKRKRDKA